MEHNSILDLFVHNVRTHRDRTAAMVKQDGAYTNLSWGQLDDHVRKVAAGLIHLGLQPGEHVCILSNTRLEWVVADLGILAAGGATVPIYPSNMADECQYIVDDARAVYAFVEDAGQAQKLRSQRESLPNLRKVIQFDGQVDAGDDWVVSLADVKALAEPDEAALEERRRAVTRDSILTIIYTSGTTGRPKGVVLTHDNMLYEAEAVRSIDVVREEDVQLLFLPMAHVFAKVLEIAWLATSHILAIAESIDALKQNLVEVRPTIMASVPRVFEKLHTAVMQKGMSAGGLKAKLFAKAVQLSQKNGEAEDGGPSLSLLETVQFALLKRIIFKKINENLLAGLGGRMRIMVSGGAPLAKKIGWFFRDAGISILEGYGLTETSAASVCNRPDDNFIGTVGRPIPGTELKIAEDGEILLRSRGIMREYWNKPEATAEVLTEDGWFHTGDVGEIDANGRLRITDRKKDLIITAGGKNVAPQNIENLLKTHNLISQVVVHGDKRKYLTALVTLDPDALKAFAKEHNLGNGSHADIVRKPQVEAHVEKVVQDFNRQLASYETIKRFKILEHDFSQETGELTPTLKVKRKVINQRYQDIFDSFYEERY